MKTNEELKGTPRLLISFLSEDGGCGVVHFHKWSGTVIWSFGGGWEHVSVSPFKKHITPTYEDMCRLKGMFFRKDECVVEYHPAEDEYVNNMPNCLHLWRPIEEKMPTPPSWMVGVRKGQTMNELRAEIEEYERSER